MHRRDFLRTGAAIGTVAAVSFPAFGQGNNIVVWSGFPPGGLGDQVSRPLMEQLRGKFPQNLIYDTKPGAAGRIAADFVKRSAPNGENLLQCPAGVLTLHPHVFKKLNYDPLVDFAPVAGICNFTFVFTAGPGLPAEIKSVADYVRWAKLNPAQANYGVPSTGTSLHMAGMLLSRAAGLDMRVIPYKGGGPLLTDLLGGQVPVSVNVVSEVLPHIRSGKLRALAVTSPSRWKAMPDTPTFVELGYKDISFTEWLGWFAPSGTPAANVNALNAAVNGMLDSAAMRDVFERNALEPLGETPAKLTARLKTDYDYWARVVKSTGFTPEE
ncbi:Bug family tripartite tricarboxylate transporter substrate binding protein [Variovorax saccharolyticus]|uniref:Bug family tripartite tricarboxylate transporter substrate binding protein n=1 Tax=Variovorax saccharolyticus TaxID=3053516 RepID=UPI0025749C74|nr:tripartite tricarboxylate transporter substrate-binding protein [Variovorax sp. J31P216]MDM0028366.1 tripartite tricarboxylate transporter substrate-binding protein [Variovorax sp. J31P216]